jgi:hypothetical protein
MIKLINILQEVVGSIYKDDPNTWTHATNRDEVIQSIKQKGKWIGKDENLDAFVYKVQPGRFITSKDNGSVPNFFKGKPYPGTEGTKYLITFTPKQQFPDIESYDWSEVDYPLMPSKNFSNNKSFKQSGNIGILKPEYRDKKNFKFYKFDGKNYVEFDINNI